MLLGVIASRPSHQTDVEIGVCVCTPVLLFMYMHSKHLEVTLIPPVLIQCHGVISILTFHIENSKNLAPISHDTFPYLLNPRITGCTFRTANASLSVKGTS